MPRERRRLGYRAIVAPLLLTGISACLAFVVIRGLVLAAEGAHDRWQFWPVIAFFGLVS